MAKLQCVAESALETGAFSLLLKLYERLVLGEDVARMCQVMIWSGQVHDKLHECTLVLMRKACRKTGMILVQSVQQAVVQPCFVCSALLNVRREFYCAFLLIFSYQHITLVKAIGSGIIQAKIILSQSLCALCCSESVLQPQEAGYGLALAMSHFNVHIKMFLAILCSHCR